MSQINVTLASSHTGQPAVDVGEDTLFVWPAGKPGALLTISAEDWRALNRAVEAALAADDRLEIAQVVELTAYSAQEGNNGDED